VLTWKNFFEFFEIRIAVMQQQIESCDNSDGPVYKKRKIENILSLSSEVTSINVVSSDLNKNETYDSQNSVEYSEKGYFDSYAHIVRSVLRTNFWIDHILFGIL
jgi:hypothetical protein